MGEIAEMMLDGTLCQCCGEFIGGEGFPQYCPSCAKDARQAERKAKPTSHNKRHVAIDCAYYDKGKCHSSKGKPMCGCCTHDRERQQQHSA